MKNSFFSGIAKKNSPLFSDVVRILKFFSKNYISSRETTFEKMRYPTSFVFECCVAKILKEEKFPDFYSTLKKSLEFFSKDLPYQKPLLKDPSTNLEVLFKFTDNFVCNEYKTCFFYFLEMLEMGLPFPKDMDFGEHFVKSRREIMFLNLRNDMLNKKNLVLCDRCMLLLSPKNFSEESLKIYQQKSIVCENCKNEMENEGVKDDHRTCKSCKKFQHRAAFLKGNEKCKSCSIEKNKTIHDGLYFVDKIVPSIYEYDRYLKELKD